MNTIVLGTRVVHITPHYTALQGQVWIAQHIESGMIRMHPEFKPASLESVIVPLEAVQDERLFRIANRFDFKWVIARGVSNDYPFGVVWLQNNCKVSYNDCFETAHFFPYETNAENHQRNYESLSSFQVVGLGLFNDILKRPRVPAVEQTPKGPSVDELVRGFFIVSNMTELVEAAETKHRPAEERMPHVLRVADIAWNKLDPTKQAAYYDRIDRIIHWGTRK